MNNTLIPLLGSIIPLLLFAFFAIFLFKQYRKKEKLLMEKMNMLGFSFVEELRHPIMNKRNNFWIFSGYEKQIIKMFEKEDELIKITIFNFYSYPKLSTIQNRKSRKFYSQVVLMFESNSLNLPLFKLSQEKLSNKIGALFGYKDINFDNYPKFSSRYLLNGKDEDRVREFFSSDILDFFTDNKEKVNIEGENNILLFYKERKKNQLVSIPIKNIESMIEQGKNIFNIFSQKY